jgi:hypothetical protein
MMRVHITASSVSEDESNLPFIFLVLLLFSISFLSDVFLPSHYSLVWKDIRSITKTNETIKYRTERERERERTPVEDLLWEKMISDIKSSMLMPRTCFYS